MTQYGLSRRLAAERTCLGTIEDNGGSMFGSFRDPRTSHPFGVPPALIGLLLLLAVVLAIVFILAAQMVHTP